MLLGEVAQGRGVVAELFGVGLAAGRVAVDVPVRRAVDAVGVGRLVAAALELAPDEMLEVVLDRLDLFLVRKDDVLGREEGGLAEAGIVAGQGVDHAVEEDVRVLDRPGDLGRHVVGPVDAVPPFRRVLDLLARDEEGRPLLDQRLQRLGDEELEEGPAAAVVDDRQHVLAEPAEDRLVDAVARDGLAEGPDRRLIGEFGPDLLDPGLRVQREARREVLGHGHPRDDADVEEPRLVKQGAELVVALRPTGTGSRRSTRLPGLARGRELERRVGLAPSPALFRRAAPAGVDEDPAARPAAPVPVFELRPGTDGHEEVGRGARGADEIDE